MLITDLLTHLHNMLFLHFGHVTFKIVIKMEKLYQVYFTLCVIITGLLQIQGLYFASISFKKEKEKNLYRIYSYIHCILNYISDRIEILFWLCIDLKKSLCLQF